MESNLQPSFMVSQQNLLFQELFQNLFFFFVDFVNEDLRKHFPSLVPHVRITLLELMDHILNTYDKRISECN